MDEATTVASFTLRPVRPDDAEGIADIYNGYVERTTVSFETEAVSADEMRRRIGALAPAFPYFVAEDGEGIAGYCYAHPWKERAAYAHTLETTIYLSPRHVGCSLGRQLMEMLTAECRRRGVHALIACITADNARSIAFHERLGFRRVSLFREVGRKFDRWLDVADLQLLLD